VQIRKLEQVIASVTARNLTLYRAVAKAVVTTTIRLRCDWNFTAQRPFVELRHDLCVWAVAWRPKSSCAGSRTICPRPCTPHAAAHLQPIHALRLRRPARLAPWIFM